MIHPKNIFFILCFFSHLSHAQFSFNEFLSQAKNDVRLYEHAQKSKFLEKNPYKSPWIQRTEIRLRTNDLNISADDYRFRINPTNPFEIRANRMYYQMEFELLFSEYQRALNAALNERYQLVLEFLEGAEMHTLKNKQIDLISDEIRLLNAQTGDPNFSLIEYLEAKENLLQAHLESNEIYHKNELIKIEIETKYEFDGNIQPEDIDLVELPTLKKWMNTLLLDFDTTGNILVESLSQENLLTEQRIKLEKAEDRRNIGFVQAEYDRYRGNEVEEHLGFQVGIRIPLTNPDRPDMNRSKIDLIEDQANLEERKAEVSLQGQLIRVKFNYLFSQYETLSNEIKESDFLEMISQSPELDPMDLLKTQRSLLRLQRLGTQLKWEIYKSYIDYLYFSGKLIESPLKNYLSANLSEI